MFVIVHNQSVILGPMPWRKLFFENIIMEDCEISVTLPQKNDSVIVVNEDIVILPARYEETEYNTNTEQLNGPYWTFTDTEAVGAFTVMPKNIDIIRSEAAAKVTEKRWEKEVGGTKVNIKGTEYSVDTSREGRNIYIQAYQLGAVTNWKFPEGWIDLSVEDLGTIVMTIANHVQASFAEEKTLLDTIATATVQELDTMINSYKQIPNRV